MKSPEVFGFGGTPDLEKVPQVEEKQKEAKKEELSEARRLEQEREVRFRRSMDCGSAAFGELSGSMQKEELEEIYKREGRFLENSVSGGYIWFGNMNIPAKDVRTLGDYIGVLKELIGECEQKLESPDAENQLKRENYERWLKEAQATLEGFGKAAMKAGDAITARESLEHVGYLNDFPELREELNKKVEEMEKAELERKRREEELELERSVDCGIIAYAELTGKMPKEKLEEIYAREGRGIVRNSMRLKHLWFGHKNIPLEKPVLTPEGYIEALGKSLKEWKEKLAGPDGEVPLYRKNFQYWIKEGKKTLESFGNAAQEAGDTATYSRVQEVLQELG